MSSRHFKTVVALVLCASSTFAFSDQQVPVYQPSGQVQAAQQNSTTQMDPKWEKAANIQLHNLMNGSGQNIAVSIQSITHPSGKNASLQSFNVLNLGDHMMVQINVTWYGGMLGAAYVTNVNWELSPSGNMGAKVVGDSAMVAIAKPNLQALDDYFRQTVFPVFYSNMEGVAAAWK